MNAEKKKNILIVDDDPFLQSLYRKTLEREGFNIVTAVDGLDAVEMLPNICADLVVLDLMLPKIHGLKVLETIRADSHLKDLPVLILSNAYLPETAQKAMQAKATTGMLKSECSPKQLVKIIKETLRQADLETAPANSAAEKPPGARSSWFSGLLGGKGENSSQPQAGSKTAAPTESVGTATSKSEDSISTSSLEIQSELLKSWPTDIGLIRDIGLKYVKTVGTQESEEHLKNLYRRLRLLGARATIGEMSSISQLSNALEAMLFEHGFNLKRTMFPSVLQTMVQAVDCIEYLFKTGRTNKRQIVRKNKILLVDDDPVCNMANELALKRANFETVCVGDGTAALTMLQNKAFDLILLDVNMPVMSGFDVCKKIRQLPLYKEVPVIFVTINDDFQSRAQSVLSGSNGLISKPISPLELIVKSLVYLLRSQDGNPATEMSLAGQSGGSNRAVTGDQTKRPAAEPPKPDGRVKELKATQAAVEDRVKALTQALATETKRREEAEQQAAANARLQTRLETARVDNQNANEYFERMLVESKQQAQNSQGNEAWKLEGRNRALESVRNFVQDKVRNLTEVLEEQTKKSEAAKKEAAEYANRKLELEAALAEIEQAKNNLMKEIEAAGNGKLRGGLEAALAENRKKQDSLLEKIERNRQKFQIQQEAQAGESSTTESRKPDAASEAQVKALNEALAAEKKRCAIAEQQAAEISERRQALEAELIASNQAQEQLRNALAEQQQRLAAQVVTQNVELDQINDRAKDLAAAQAALAELNGRHANVAGQVQTLTEELVAESGRRTSVEREAAKLQARRAELEQELAERTLAQEQLRAELAEKQRLLDEQVQTQNVQSGNASEQAKELAAARAALAELQARHENAAGQVQTLTESLTAESGRRTTVEQQTAELMARRAELEKEMAARTQAQAQLRAELAEKQRLLDEQVQAHNAELSTRTQALEGDRATMEAKVKELVQALVAEKERSKIAEQQAAGVNQQRGTLELELAQSHQVQEQLRAQLAEQQQRLDAQVQTHNVELGNFSSRVQELEAAQVALAELKARHAGATEQVQALNESLAAESGRRATAEQTAAELAARRAELEAELAQRTQAQAQLRAELSQQQTRLDAQVQDHRVELGNFNERLQELEATQAALADLQAQHAGVAGQVQTLTESLKSESDRRAAAEQTAAELAARRAELERELAQRTQTQEQLRAELAEKQQRLDAQVQTHNVELENFGARVKELEATRAALEDLQAEHAGVAGQVRSLTETLTTESSRRESAEKQSAELAARRAELESELAQRSLTQEQLRAELAEQQGRLNAAIETHNQEVQKFEARVKELAAAQTALAELEAQHAGVTRQVHSLNESLTTESGRREDAERQVAKLIAQRIEMERDITHRTQAQAQLRADLAEQEQRLDAEIKGHKVEQGRLAERSQELAAAQTALAELRSEHAGVTRQVQTLAESLKSESDRRESAEKQSAELAARRAELEQELTQRSQTQEQLRAELAEQQQRLEAQVQAHNVELGKLAERTRELEATQAELGDLKFQHAEVTGQVKALTEQVRLLTESLQAETGRRASAEQQAAELVTRRTELEQELTERTKTQAALRAELTEQQQRLDAEVRAHNVEQGRLAERSQELAATQTALAELESKHVGVTRQVQTLAESLKSESGRRESAEKQSAELIARRTELESELAQRTLTQEQLRAELAEQQSRLNAAIETHNLEVQKFEVRVKELEAVQGTLAELQKQHAGVTRQVQSLTESLNHESGRREEAELQVAKLVAHRTELEQDIVQRTQIQEQLRAELAEKQQRLDAEVQAHNVEQGRLAERNHELEAAQTALAELKSHHTGVTQQVERLTESLKSETSRRESVEQQASELVARRAELEQELTHRTESQARLNSELTEKQQRMDAVAAELNEARRRAETEAVRQQQMAGQFSQSEQARAELGQQLSEARDLAAGREATIRSLESELQKQRGEHDHLNGLLQAEVAQRRQLEDQIATVQTELDETSSHLAQKCAAEQVWLGRESELQKCVRNQRDEIARSSATLAVQAAEIQNSRTKIADFETQHSALIGKIQALTGQTQTLTESLTTESSRRAAVEQQTAELTVRRGELEQQLAQNKQSQLQLRADLAEQQQRLQEQVQAHQVEVANLAARTQELEAARTDLAEFQVQHANLTERMRSLAESLKAESGRREVAEKQLVELNARRVELEQEIARRAQEQEQLRIQLAEQVQTHKVEVANLAARTKELEATRVELAEWQARHTDATAQVRSLTASLATEASRREAAEQVWLGREAELQNHLRTQEGELAKSSVRLAGQAVEIKNARQMIEELQVLQSALCNKIQNLTSQGEAAAKFVQELKANVARSEKAVSNREKNLAGLRYAVLDAARMNARLHRERSHKERQNQDVLRRLLSSFAQTPLSLAQRGLLAELQHSVDNLKNTRSGALNPAHYPVELPSLRGSEFDFTEITESAFQAVRMAATAAGVTVQASASGSTPQCLIGCAEHVHQLITLLAISPITVTTGVNALDLQVAIKPQCARFAELSLRVALTSDDDTQELLRRLTSVTAAAASLQTGSFNEAEIGLAAGWQLAEALGARAAWELGGGKDVCLVLSLPVEMNPVAPVSINDAVDYAPSRNGHGNGNGQHSRNGKTNGHGYHLAEARAEFAD